METNHPNQEGRLQISSKALEEIVWYAATEVDGVCEIRVCDAPIRDLKNLLTPPGAIVVEVKNGVVDVSLSLVLSEQVNLVEVCEKVQNNVKNAIQNMSAITVGRVNITVGGLAEGKEE